LAAQLHWRILIRTQANGKQAEICAQIGAGAVRSQIFMRIERSFSAPQPRESIPVFVTQNKFADAKSTRF